MAFVIPLIIGGAYTGLLVQAVTHAIEKQITNSDPRLEKINKLIKELEEEKERKERENKKRKETWDSEKIRIEKISIEEQRKEGEEQLRLQQIANEQKEREDAERQEKERKRLLKAKEEMKKNLQNNGGDCVDQPLKKWLSNNVINVAVSGNSGVGKSTLVNRLLNLKGDQRAKIGVIECTDVIDRATFEPPRQSKYNQQGDKILDVFDCPGCGTEDFPAASQIKDFGLRYFHLVIIVTAERIFEADINLKKNLEEFGVPCLFVRNKVDNAVETNLEENEIPPEETLKEIKNYYIGKGISDPILISAKNKSQEWNKLVNEWNHSIKRMIGNAEQVEYDIDMTCELCCASWIDTTFQDCGHRSICSKCASNQVEHIKNCQRCGSDIKEIKYD